MTKTDTTLTWLEEWYLYFEIIYGKTLARWVRILRETYDRKLNKVLHVSRKILPRYVTMEEDESYSKQDDEKWEKYEGKRIIMFDNANVIIITPNNAEAQRVTYSLYYAGNCGKGAVYIQPCGWMGSHELWSGGVSDSQYMTDGNVFNTLNTFIQRHKPDEEKKKIKFTIILDGGYRIVVEAFNNGGHFTLQPVFGDGDRHFTTEETILSAGVATDRSGNERAVRYSKISNYITKGLITKFPSKLHVQTSTLNIDEDIPLYI
jgi:hypothetical protein